MLFSCSEYKGERLDAAVAGLCKDITRSRVQRGIEQGEITVNGLLKKSSYKLKETDQIQVLLREPKEYTAAAQNIPIDIIYQDADVAVINKPKGMVVHPAPGHIDGTLVNALMYHIKDLSGIGGVLRPGIVHRLDKDTSGLILIAKNDAAHNALCSQLKDKTMHREYLAVCKGSFSKDSFIIEKDICRHKVDRKKMAVCARGMGRYAKTKVDVLKQSACYALVRCRLYTGRTHQIRVHMASIGHSLVGDLVYGSKCSVNYRGQALHAQRLSFIHPRDGRQASFSVDPPLEFKNLCKKVKL